MKPNASHIIQWIANEGMKAPSIPHLLDGFTKQLNQQDLEIIRSVVIVRTLHPQIVMIRYGWEPVGVNSPRMENIYAMDRSDYDFSTSFVNEITYTYGIEDGDRYQDSPYKPLDEGASMVQCRISSDIEEFEFPVIRDLQAIGSTHYLAIPLQSQNSHTGLKNIISWATSKQGGFLDEDINFFKEVGPIFAICLGMHVNHFITNTLLKTYLGQHPGRRVLHGKIRKGDIDTIEAAIWYSDLRDFTKLSENIDSKMLVEWLNEYFETISQIITQYGGEILKFIGDAILAIFPVPESSERASICNKALAAAKLSNSKLDDLNTERLAKDLTPLGHGIALHEGLVQYGNIGAIDRLDFTVIGQAVNLAARIEGLCSGLKKTILVSQDFMDCIESDDLVFVDTFDLKGINHKQSVFTIS